MSKSFVSSFVALAAASVASAGTVYVNSNSLYAGAIGDSVVGAKYRLSNTNFDQSLDNGAGTNTFGGGKNTFIQSNLGNVSTLNPRTYDFTLEHQAGKGFLYTLKNGSTTTALVWGSGLSGVPGGAVSAASLYDSATTTVTPGASFNSLYLEMRATNNTSQGTLSNLAFSGASVAGGFINESVDNTTAGYGGTVGYSRQRLVSDTDLSSFNWTLTGSIALSKSGTGGDEATKFTVIGQNVEAVPEPTSMAVLALGGIALLRRRRSAK
jgi:hypothetical protein